MAIPSPFPGAAGAADAAAAGMRRMGLNLGVGGYAPLQRPGPLSSSLTKAPAPGIQGVRVVDLGPSARFRGGGVAAAGGALLAGGRTAPTPQGKAILIGAGLLLLGAGALVEFAKQYWGQKNGNKSPAPAWDQSVIPLGGTQPPAGNTVGGTWKLERMPSTGIAADTRLPPGPYICGGSVQVPAGYELRSQVNNVVSVSGPTVTPFSHGPGSPFPNCGTVDKIEWRLTQTNGNVLTAQAHGDSAFGWYKTFNWQTTWTGPAAEPLDLPDGAADPTATTRNIEPGPLQQAPPAPPLVGPQPNLGLPLNLQTRSGTGGNNAGNATGSPTRSGNNRGSFGQSLGRGTEPERQRAVETIGQAAIREWARGFADPPAPEKLQLGLNLAQGQPPAPDPRGETTQGQIQGQGNQLMPGPFLQLPPAPAPNTGRPKVPGLLDQLTIGRPGTGPGPAAPGPGTGTITGPPDRKVGGPIDLLKVPGTGTPLGPDGEPKPPSDPEDKPKTGPDERKYGSTKIIGGPGAGPRADLTSIALELGRIEQKLGKMLDPPAPTPPDPEDPDAPSPNLWNQLQLLLPLLEFIANEISIETTGDTWTLTEVCPPAGEEPEVYEWQVPGVAVVNQGVAARLDAIAQMLQVHKNLKQPVCRTVPQGQPVQVQFIQSETEWETPP